VCRLTLTNTNQKTTDFEDCTIKHFATPVEALIGKLVVGTYRNVTMSKLKEEKENKNWTIIKREE